MEKTRPAQNTRARVERTKERNTVISVFFIALYSLIVLSPPAFLLAYGPPADSSFAYELGRTFALMGFVIIAMQFALSSRAKWMERPYGLDMVYGFHKRMAILGGALLVLHPILLISGEATIRLLIAPDVRWNIWLARAALAFLLLHIFLSVFRSGLGIGFERWRFVHNIFAVSILAAGFVHGMVTSSVSLRLTPLRGLWLALAGAAVLFYGYRKIFMPVMLRRGLWRLADIHRETHDVWTLTFRPPMGRKRFAFLPGQFQFITLRRGEGLPREEHPFSISSSPAKENMVSSSIKESGDFTRLIGKTRVGDTASIEGPFGRFSYLLHPEDREIVFIAGGIGITPLMGMLRHMRDTRHEHSVLLLYANRSERDIAFRGELSKMEASRIPRLRVVHILEYPGPEWNGARGRIDRRILERYAGRSPAQAFYVCGPPPMMDAATRLLRGMGVPENRIRMEVFHL